ncbi:MAG: hypothetical protein V1653_02580 [bacterium]
MFEKMDERVKKLTTIDIGLTKLAVFFGTIIVVRLFPQLLNISFLVLAVLMIACAVKPFYAFWVKK